VKKVAINEFAPISYAARKAPNKGRATGKSSRLAQILTQPATATLVLDPVPGSGPSSTNKPTIAHASLHQYLFEDVVVFSSLGDMLLLCVFESGDSVVGYTPAFMAAVAGSIPVFPTCSFVKSGALYTLYTA
jgi:hypothetical protein